MAPTYLFMFILSALASFSGSLPAGNNSNILLGGNIKTERNALRLVGKDDRKPNLRNADELIFNEYSAGDREEGDFVIHRYSVGPITIGDVFNADIVFNLPEKYYWTYVSITIGQLNSLNMVIFIYDMPNRRVFNMSYYPFCLCNLVQYEVVLYAVKRE